MWVSESAFRRGLLEEHHDELAFLYRQTARLRDEGELPLERLADFERRLVAHLDALKLGGSPAWRVIGERHDDGDTAHWYAAGLLACAQGDDRRFGALLERARAQDSAVAAPGLADALRHAMPVKWGAQLVAWLPTLPQPLLGELACVASFQGTACRAALENRVREGCEPSVGLVRALGRCGAVAATAWLEACAQSEAGPELTSAALLALSELGAAQALPLLRGAAESKPAWHPLLGLVGNRADAQLLLRRLAAQPAADTALALGLLGELSAVRPLVSLLDHEAVGGAAATALHWITGAELFESVLEPDEDAQASDEPAAGEAPYARLRPGGALARPAGTEVKRISQDRLRWAAWLAEASGRFHAGQRYRFGREYSLPTLLHTLAGDTPDHGAYRRWAVEELAARHRAPRRLDLRSSTGRQRATLRQLEDWAATLGEGHVRDGWALADGAV